METWKMIKTNDGKLNSNRATPLCRREKAGMQNHVKKRDRLS
jgi:hypothetical protein